MAIARPELPSTASKAGGLVPRALKCSRRSRPPQPRLRYRVIADSRKWLILHSLNAERTYSLAYIRERNQKKLGSSHKCMHDLAPGRSATAVGRRCGCARARYAAVQSSVAQLTAACAGPALGGGPARRQPDQTQAADSMALTWPRTVKASGTRPRLSPMFCAGAERSLTVQPPWNWQPRHDSGVCCGRTFREPATPLQIQTVFFSHVSH